MCANLLVIHTKKTCFSQDVCLIVAVQFNVYFIHVYTFFIGATYNRIYIQFTAIIGTIQCTTIIPPTGIYVYIKLSRTLKTQFYRHPGGT